MSEASLPKISIDELIEKIRAEALRRKAIKDNSRFTNVSDSASKISSLTHIDPIKLDLVPGSLPFNSRSDSYDIGDFLQYHDQHFVENAYRGILRRDPDSPGLHNYLQKLRKGRMSKTEILGRLRYSPEGRDKKVVVKGLLWTCVLHSCFRIPILGHFLRWLTALFQIPTIIKNLEDQDQLVHSQYLHMKEYINRLACSVENRINQIIDQQACYIEDIRKTVHEEDHLRGAFYASFEDKLNEERGGMEARGRVYLPYLQAAKAGTEDAPILDVGCGWGQWLEFLRATGYVARGLDRNRVMVQNCLERGLDVVEADVIEGLRRQEANSLGAITGLHIIEHLPLKSWLSFLQEALRILKPGGLVILETPNPRNLLVGSSDFYRDPTRTTPIFPDTMEIVGEILGFSESIAYFSIDSTAQLRPASEQKFDQLDDYLTISKDFVWLGYKR